MALTRPAAPVTAPWNRPTIDESAWLGKRSEGSAPHRGGPARAKAPEPRAPRALGLARAAGAP